jgi:hypothetical protein
MFHVRRCVSDIHYQVMYKGMQQCNISDKKVNGARVIVDD